MVAEVITFAFDGIDARKIKVQVQLTGGVQHFMIVGLPDKAVCEARERVRAAFAAIGLGLPPKRISVNLAPADIPKEGSHFDLPIAIALLIEMGAAPRDMAEGFAFLGELGLDGSIAPTHGALPAAVAANSYDLGLVCPAASGPEAAWAGGDARIIAPGSLIQLINHFKGTQVLRTPEPGGLQTVRPTPGLEDVKGQESARRALEIAAAGGHNLLFIGPPGAGKSMLAARLPGILPPLSAQEMLEVSMIQSMGGLLEEGRLSAERPFRSPHHSASMAAMVGGGQRAKPGEASLAHHGVLFLDELPEFSGAVLDSLRQPLETGDVLISRANAHVRYPAAFQLIAAMNPCKCGYGRASGRNCGRGPNCEASYQSRISGPFLDRMDLTVETPPVSALDLTTAPNGEASAPIASRVLQARQMQTERIDTHYKNNADRQTKYPREHEVTSTVNARLSDHLLGLFAKPDNAGTALLTRAAQSLNLSARAYHRTLRVARTLADLEGHDGIRRIHIAEAISFRQRVTGISAKPAALSAPVPSLDTVKAPGI